MSLREQAEADLGIILEDDINGFGWPITITNPAGVSESLVGFSSDITQLIDPETGAAVSGRLASVALRIKSLVLAGFTELPRNIPDATSKPWLIQFDDINGNAFTFKVSDSNPDRAMGLIVCVLEAYTP